MPPTRCLDVVHLLIRDRGADGVRFLIYPDERWKNASGRPFLKLPTKKTVISDNTGIEPFQAFHRGTSLEHFIDEVMQQDLKLHEDDYALEQEIEPAWANLAKVIKEGAATVTSLEDAASFPGSIPVVTHYTIYPVDVWVAPSRRESLGAEVHGQWRTCPEALELDDLSPSAAAVFRLILERERQLDQRYTAYPELEARPNAPRRLLRGVGDRPTMEALARAWFSKNRQGMRILSRRKLDEILAAGNRAFNLRVADPYLRYQLQGVGFTWSFFTHKDPQDIHVHGAPVVEIYGVLEGRLEVWWKPYYDRGTSAWSHCILEAGDWLEVDSLQCHLVHWLGEGKGVVFKAGPGPLAEVGRIGIKGKTRCECQCMKPPEVVRLT